MILDIILFNILIIIFNIEFCKLSILSTSQFLYFFTFFLLYYYGIWFKINSVFKINKYKILIKILKYKIIFIIF